MKLCVKLTGKFLTTASKPKVLRLKLDEDPLQRRIYFLTFMESLEIILPQYKETCWVLIDDPTMEGEDIKYHVSKAISNLLHENIDVHIIIFVAPHHDITMKS